MHPTQRMTFQIENLTEGAVRNHTAIFIMLALHIPLQCIDFLIPATMAANALESNPEEMNKLLAAIGVPGKYKVRQRWKYSYLTSW